MSSDEHPPLKVTFLSGQRVDLRPLEKEDLGLLRQWANDPEIRGLTGEVTPAGQAAMEEYFQKVQADSSRVWFAIVAKDAGRVIGECGLLRMFPAWRTTDLSLILGDKTAWSKGYGADAIRLLLDYAFGYLNFHRVAIGVVGSNDRALRFYEKAVSKKRAFSATAITITMLTKIL
jgi:diamine N-acetyltransferase